MSKPKQLSDLQLAILRVLWAREEATVAEVQEALRADRDLALTTVATMLSRLAGRGIVERRTEGRQFVYRAAVKEQEVRRSMVSALMDRLFEGDPAALVNHLLDEGAMDRKQLDRLKRMLARAPRDRARKKGGKRVR